MVLVDLTVASSLIAANYGLLGITASKLDYLLGEYHQYYLTVLVVCQFRDHSLLADSWLI